MRLQVIGSGSSGNSVIVSSGGATLLVDMGFSCRKIKSAVAEFGVEAQDISGVLITHDHSDHYKGLETFHKKYPEVPLYANGNTADAICVYTKIEDWMIFETAEEFSIGPFNITSFSISHDAADPVGYLIDDGASRLFIGTDLGVVTLPVKVAFSQSDFAILESNHDPELLMQSDRAFSLKQRISGRSGHLSNREEENLFRETNPKDLKTLLLAHLSQECNKPHLALEEMRLALEEHKRGDVAIFVLEQDTPSQIFEF
jgi:phosphoribosyl 1,2-cyclic phosphodiesterase